MESGEVFRLAYVAANLGVGKRTVYRLAAAKRIPAFKVGGSWRFLRTDIDAWIRQRSLIGLDTRRENGDVANGQSADGRRD